MGTTLIGRLCATCALLLLASACGDNGREFTGPGNAIALALHQNALTLQPGRSGTVAISIERIGAFAGPVDLELSGVLHGVTATFSQTTIPPSATDATLSLAAASDMQIGVSTPCYAPRDCSEPRRVNQRFVITARGAGVADESARLSVEVLPLFDLRIFGGTSGDTPWRVEWPVACIAEPGGSDQVKVEIQRLGDFAGMVDFSVDGLPPGLAASIGPMTLAESAQIAELTVTAAPTLPAGGYSFLFQASAENMVRNSIMMNVDVGGPDLACLYWM
jgi:hypothetical protein